MKDSWLRFEHERTRTEGEWLRARVAMHVAIFLGAALGIAALVAVVVMALRVEQLEDDLAAERAAFYTVTSTGADLTGTTNAVVMWPNGFEGECLTYEHSNTSFSWQPCAQKEPTP